MISGTTKANPRMIVLGRESRGLTQLELAQACQISQSLLSKIEAGLVALPKNRLARLVRTLGYRREFFFEETRIGALGSTCLQFRKRQALSVRKLREIVARVNIRRIQIEKLVQDIEIQDPKFAQLPIDEYGEPEKIAQLVRSSWGLPLGPIPNLVRTIESAGGVVVKADFGTELFDAVSQWFPGMPPIFFVNARMPVDRMRFTLAHEVGHVVMHSIASNEGEHEASRFAAEFLMPAREIRADLEPVTPAHLADLKLYWRVAMQALLYRARDLEVITPARYRSMMMFFSSRGLRRDEGIYLEPEEPELLKEIVRVHEKDHGYTPEDLARLMLAPVDDLVGEILPPTGPQLRIVG
jgi:Zn-dependent peptidase ImmA (M78 family)/DNA-binding XRE family transcriptional regulator